MSLDYSEINIKYDDYNLVCYDSGVNKNENTKETKLYILKKIYERSELVDSKNNK